MPSLTRASKTDKCQHGAAGLREAVALLLGVSVSET